LSDLRRQGESRNVPKNISTPIPLSAQTCVPIKVLVDYRGTGEFEEEIAVYLPLFEVLDLIERLAVGGVA
jgi:hypothetical protein